MRQGKFLRKPSLHGKNSSLGIIKSQSKLPFFFKFKYFQHSSIFYLMLLKKAVELVSNCCTSFGLLCIDTDNADLYPEEQRHFTQHAVTLHYLVTCEFHETYDALTHSVYMFVSQFIPFFISRRRIINGNERILNLLMNGYRCSVDNAIRYFYMEDKRFFIYSSLAIETY